MYNIHASGITSQNTQTCLILVLYTYCSINEQDVEGVEIDKH